MKNRVFRQGIRYFPIVFLALSYAFLSFTEGESALCPYKAGPERSGGLGAVLGVDGTGGPLSGGTTCAGCHSGGTFNPSIVLVVRDAANNPVTSYDPGQIYTLEFTVAASSGSPSGYGMQAVPLTAGNTPAGSIGTVITSNTQVTNIGGAQYLEHQFINTAGFFSAQWTAPSNGTGQVSFYAIGLAANGNFGITGDNPTSPQVFSLSENIATSISYTDLAYCNDAAPQTPVITGTQGGTFTSSAGLVINASTGVIDIAGSLTGSYTVTYTYDVSSTATANVTIHPTYNMNTSAMICQNETYPFGSLILTAADSGLNVSTFQSVEGCDSVVTLDLSVSYVDTIITQTSQFTAEANAIGAGYQWLDCDNNHALIPGENQQIFSAVFSGNYAVEITQNGCADTSACIFLDASGIPAYDFGELSLSPNPTSGKLYIALGEVHQSIYVRQLSVEGDLVCERVYSGTDYIEFILEGVSGYYLLEIGTQDQRSVVKVLKKL